MNKKLKFIILFSLIIFFFAFQNNSQLVINSDYITLILNYDNTINRTINDNLLSGVESYVNYKFSLYYLSSRDNGSTKKLISVKEYDYKIKYDKTSQYYIVYDNEIELNFSTVGEVSKYIFRRKFSQLFKLNDTGYYFIRSNIKFRGIKLVPPFSIILLFVDIYNIDIKNSDSKIIYYEKK